ncbi:unnamed protein product [Timema podura]|uniref:Uncharacterized protein n=1 Tax=Timema podura TaxID=61482 RepID=A0ABN7NKR2_TIMPD|nr:unnamed protein product [Timema podura]
MNGTFVNIFALWNTMMGTTTLAIAWGIDKAGLAAGVILVISHWRPHLVHQPSHHQTVPKTRLLLGRNYELVVKITTVFSMICCIIIYYILMSSFLFDLVNLIHDCIQSSRNELTHPLDSKENPSSKIWNLRTVPLYLIVIIMPLVNIKTPVFFTKFNALGTLASAYIILFVLVKGILWGVNVDLRDKGSVHYTPLFRPATFPILTGMLTMSFCIHATVITVVRSNKYPNRNNDVQSSQGLHHCIRIPSTALELVGAAQDFLNIEKVVAIHRIDKKITRDLYFAQTQISKLSTQIQQC